MLYFVESLNTKTRILADRNLLNLFLTDSVSISSRDSESVCLDFGGMFSSNYLELNAGSFKLYFSEIQKFLVEGSLLDCIETMNYSIISSTNFDLVVTPLQLRELRRSFFEIGN